MKGYQRNDTWPIFYLGAVMVSGLVVFFLAGAVYLTWPSFVRWNEFAIDQALVMQVETEISKWESYADDKFIHAQTMTLSAFIMFQLFNVMNCRSKEESIFICVFLIKG